MRTRRRTTRSNRTPRGRRGVVLLEIVLASGLFATAALVVLAGLNSCYRAVEDMQLEATAADLAVSKLSEIRMGLLAAEDDGPNEYEVEELAGWTWEIVTADTESPIEGPQLKQITIIIASEPHGYVQTLRFLVSATEGGEQLEREGTP